MKVAQLPEYEKPEVATITDDEILEELGEAQAFCQYLTECLRVN
jgi:hypothetical protein